MWVDARTLSVKRLRDGMRMRGVVSGTHVDDARLRKHDEAWYLCQDVLNGCPLPSHLKYGFCWSWILPYVETMDRMMHCGGIRKFEVYMSLCPKGEDDVVQGN